MIEFSPLEGPAQAINGAAPLPDLAAAGYSETEYVVSGTAVSYGGHPDAEFATRVVVRRPEQDASGVVLVEWLNVSSGNDAAPDYTYLADEIVRSRHTYVAVSAQYTGVEGGTSSLGGGDGTNGLKNQLPDRYGTLIHPGDAYSYGIFTSVADAIREREAPRLLIAVGESQSAFAMTRYVESIQPITGSFDGFFIHSRGKFMLPLGESGCGVDLVAMRDDEPVFLDPGVPVITIQTETDVVMPRFDSIRSRQPDTERHVSWEVAGTAHADKWQIGEFEEFLGSPEPVNRGQQGFVLRAALRALVAWCADGVQPASAPVLETLADAEGRPGFVVDEFGNARGGVRTPVVDAPVARLSGRPAAGAPVLAGLFGTTTPLAPEVLRAVYGDAGGYLRAYETATEAAIAAGFILAEDRDAVLAQADPGALA